jgi:RHS repeat-associated protein
MSRRTVIYRGEQYDADLGLYYLRARYYNPLTGRFMSRDPEEHDPAYPNQLHKYLYVGGDPVNGRDPTGRDDVLEFVGEQLERLDLYNKFAGPNDWAGCVNSLIKSLARGTGSAVDAGLNQSGAVTKKAYECEIDLLWGGINPLPTHGPETPWQEE